MLLRRNRLLAGLIAGPLAAALGVPAALSSSGGDTALPVQPAWELPDVTDGLERHVVTVTRDLPARTEEGWAGPTWTGSPTYDENLAQLAEMDGVHQVQPLGGDRALVAVEPRIDPELLLHVRDAAPAAVYPLHGFPTPDDPYLRHAWALENDGAARRPPVGAPGRLLLPLRRAGTRPPAAAVLPSSRGPVPSASRSSTRGAAA